MSVLLYSLAVWLGWVCPVPTPAEPVHRVEPVPVYKVSPIETPKNVRPWKPKGDR